MTTVTASDSGGPMVNSDQNLLTCFRHQIRAALKQGIDAGIVLLTWTLDGGEPGVNRDDLIDIYRELTGY